MHAVSDIIDIEVLRRNTAGDRDLIAELIGIFQQELPSIQSAILAGRVAADGNAIARSAHKLKGSLLVLGARCAATAAESLELQARNGYGPTVHDLSAKLDRKVDEVVPALQTLLQTGEL